jgi:baculoviral IAP repeat-containing protein 6
MQAQAKVFIGGFKASAHKHGHGGIAAASLASSGEDEHGMMNGLTVALHIQTVAQLMATIPLSTRGTADSNTEKCATQSSLGSSSGRYTSGARSQPAAAAAAASDGAAQTASMTYCLALKDLQLDEAEGLAGNGHYFSSVQSQGARGSRLLRQVSVLATSLPLDVGSSVFVRYDSQNLSSLRACISGPAGTPYEKGLFFFDIFLPSEFPAVPPMVQFLTTGAGRVRFNPNLYENGKVCLSLLGTWSGPGWIPNKSSLIQVLISIQSLILVEQPYFNEPSFEVSMGTPQGTKQSNACVVLARTVFGLVKSVEWLV